MFNFTGVSLIWSYKCKADQIPQLQICALANIRHLDNDTGITDILPFCDEVINWVPSGPKVQHNMPSPVPILLTEDDL